VKVGFLGGGNVGAALGEGFVRAGHEVFFGVRNPSAPDMQAVIDRSAGKAQAGSIAEAAAFSGVLVNALPWGATQAALESLDLNGKVLLDCTNPLKPDLSGLAVGTTTSAGELVASWAMGAKVVKIFNTVGYGLMANPVFEGRAIPMFYCSDDAEAKKTAASLAKDIGFDPQDGGPLTNARLLEPYAMLWIWMAVKGGYGRDFAFQLVRR
jgi:8-hydroxy-5-deazaflavin:NADPH oxidoreductase